MLFRSRLSVSMIPAVSKRRTYEIKPPYKDGIKEEIRLKKHKMQAEYSEQLKMQIKVKEENRRKERELERKFDRVERRESKPANTALEKYKVEIRKEYEQCISFFA